ncbi:MAG: AtpZ/AtpI family protein [Alphaproteobacteria bacterium]|nr:AtpZ/AtpI family protein [Alphaproteobacteria bacterium]
MSDTDPPPRDDFASRLAAARSRQAGDRDKVSDAAARNTGQFGLGFRIAVELLAGVMVGVGMGLLLDRWLGTSPWLLLVFMTLGFAAGITNMLRAVRANDKARDAARRGDGPPDHRKTMDGTN